MYKVRFIKIKNNHDRIKSDVFEGVTNELPTLKRQFGMVDDWNRPTRRLSTSTVTSINPDGTFTTASGSIYKVELI